MTDKNQGEIHRNYKFLQSAEWSGKVPGTSKHLILSPGLPGNLMLLYVKTGGRRFYKLPSGLSNTQKRTLAKRVFDDLTKKPVQQVWPDLLAGKYL